MEPNFNTNDFLKRVQYVIIPNVMESLRIGEMEILKDWCTEVVNYLIFLLKIIFFFGLILLIIKAFNMLTHPLKQCEHLKFKYHSEVLDISHLDVILFLFNFFY